MTDEIFLKHKKGGQAAPFFCARSGDSVVVGATTIFVGAGVDFDFVPSLVEGWDLDLEAGRDARRFQHLARSGLVRFVASIWSIRAGEIRALLQFITYAALFVAGVRGRNEFLW